MALSHSTAARNAMADAVVDLVDGGATDAQGDLVLFEDTTEIVRINLQDPAFGAASSGVASMQGLPLSNTASASTTGTGVNGFEVQDKDNALVFDGTVTSTGGGGDLEIDNQSVNSGQTVEVDQFDYTAAS
jgi:hypothetical protein